MFMPVQSNQGETATRPVSSQIATLTAGCTMIVARNRGPSAGDPPLPLHSRHQVVWSRSRASHGHPSLVSSVLQSRLTPLTLRTISRDGSSAPGTCMGQ
jgi:hypothetical protein